MRTIRQILLLFTIVMVTQLVIAQTNAAYSFLNLPVSARMNALGGYNVSLDDGELSTALINPSVLSDKTHKSLELNYAYLMSGINLASAIYSHNYNDNHFAVGIHFLDYGKMPYADEYGTLIGTTFGAKDMYIDLVYSRQLGEMFRVGAALKPVYSIYESYTSFALGADVGAHFQTKDKSFQLGLSLQNVGWQLKKFYDDADGGKRAMLPLNLMLGLNYRLPHAPIRFGMTVHNMQRWNLGYESSGNPTYVLTSKRGMSSEEWDLAKSNGAVMWYDMLFRHTIFFLDIVPKSDKFYLTLSYNHRRRAELGIKDQRSLAGFALGAGLNIKQVRLDFAFSQYTKGQYIYQASLTLDINGFK